MLSTQNFANMTAAEVAERHQEKMLVLGPVLERLKNELLDPLVERSYAILTRRGVLPPAPQALQGLSVGVSYISLIAQAQKATGLAALTQGIDFASRLAAVRPDVLNRVDFENALEQGLTMLGVPPGVLKSRAEVSAEGYTAAAE